MSQPDSDALRNDLTAADPAVRAAAVGRVRFRDLKDPSVLAAVVRAATDPSPVPGARSATADPFAAFFEARSEGATVGELAAERLSKAGVPETEATAELLARVLDEVPPGEGHTLPAAVARLLADSSWPDPVRAVELLVPALERHDQPLFEALVRLPSATWPTLCELATGGRVRPRLLQELMNHPPTHEPVVAALRAAVLEDRTVPDDDEAITVLATLGAWSEPCASELAAHLARRFPWAAAWGALEDPAQLPALSAWLAEGAPGLDRVWARLAEALRNRDPVPGYPIALLLRASGSDLGVLGAWGLDAEPAVQEVLRDWVRAWREDPERAWAAAGRLVDAGAHGPVLEALGAAVTDPAGELPWHAPLLERLARAVPEIPGLSEALLSGLERSPADYEEAVPALLACAHATCARAADLVLDAAARAPWEVTRVGPGAVREGPRDLDVTALAPVVARLADPATTARHDALLPVVRADRPGERE